MADETKRPTVQDIEALRKRVDAMWCRIFEVKPIRNRDDFLEYQRQWHSDLRVLDYAAACLRAEEEAERVPEVEAPEDAGDDGWIPWEGGECPVHPGDVVEYEMRSGARRVSVARRLWWKHFQVWGDIVRYRLAQTEQPDPPSQPPTDPEARVGAMSDEEVEAELTGRGVGPWRLSLAREEMVREWSPIWMAVTVNGLVFPKRGGSAAFDATAGDTTTPEGRAECSRRLLVHLLREEVARG